MFSFLLLLLLLLIVQRASNEVPNTKVKLIVQLCKGICCKSLLCYCETHGGQNTDVTPIKETVKTAFETSCPTLGFFGRVMFDATTNV